MAIVSARALRIIQTCILYLSATAGGMCTSITGPTLLDLQHNVNTDTKHISLVYTGRSIGYLAGSLIGGVIYDITLRKQLLMTIFNCLVSVSMFLIPLSKLLGVLTGEMLLNGFALGALDTGINTYCLNLWSKESGPFFHALHFTYGFGSLLAPLIAAPFLQFHEQDNNTINQMPFDFERDLANGSNVTQATIPPTFYSYAVVGSLALLASILSFAVYIVEPLHSNHEEYETLETRERRSFTVLMVVFLFLLMFFASGTEIGFAQMVTTYVVKGPLKLTPTLGSYITSTFWAAFTASRFGAIFLAIKLDNFSFVLITLCITSAGGIVLLATTEEWSLWLASTLLGAGIAPFVPATVIWVGQYITITNKIVAIFSTGAACGEMAIPSVISYLIVNVPQVLSYVVAASCILTAALIVILYLILMKERKNETETPLGAHTDTRPIPVPIQTDDLCKTPK